MVLCLKSKSAFDQRVAAYVIHSMTKHTVQIATEVINTPGSVEAIVDCIDFKDHSVKEMGCWAVSCIASHTPQLASLLIEAGVVPKLVVCL